jgi:hypothetical protein
MVRRRRKARLHLQDFGRLVAPLDVLYQVGNLIYRRSLRYTLLTVGISIVGLAANFVGLNGFTVKQAVVLPLAMGALTLGVGLALKMIPAVISSRLITVAQASGMNLMEDYRKSQVDEHLRRLWERVFSHECRLRLRAGRSVYAGCKRSGDEPLERTLQRAREQFVQRARDALCRPLPQTRQMQMIGIDLRFFEDWRDGAYLDASDEKIMQQFEGDQTLVAAQRACGMRSPVERTLTAPARASQQFWFGFITRSLATRVAGAVRKLNGEYASDWFNAQVLLWPGEEDQPWLEEFQDGREQVLAERRKVIRGVFGPDERSARRMVNHMQLASVHRATELRLRYDPEFCLGELPVDPLEDLVRFGATSEPPQWAGEWVSRMTRLHGEFMEFLLARRPGLGEDASAAELRAVRLAFHVDRGRLRSDFVAGGERTMPPEQLAESLQERIDQAAGAAEDTGRSLVSVRVHHELSRLSAEGYSDLVLALGYDGEARKHRSHSC